MHSKEVNVSQLQSLLSKNERIHPMILIRYSLLPPRFLLSNHSGEQRGTWSRESSNLNPCKTCGNIKGEKVLSIIGQREEKKGGEEMNGEVRLIHE
jgi:hypothetical protein